MRKLLIVCLLLVMTLCGGLTFALADDATVEYDTTTGFQKNPYGTKEVLLSKVYDGEEEIGVRIGLLGTYGERAIKTDFVDLRDISFTIDLREFKTLSQYSLFLADSPQGFVGNAGLGINFQILKSGDNTYQCVISDGSAGKSETDHWNLFGGGEWTGYTFTDGTLEVHIVRTEAGYECTLDGETTVIIPREEVDANIGYEGTGPAKAYLVIGSWGDSSRLISQFLYYSDVSYREYLPVKAAVFEDLEVYESAVAELTVDSSADAFTNAFAAKEGIDAASLRSADRQILDERIQLADVTLTGLFDLMDTEHYKTICEQVMSDYEESVDITETELEGMTEAEIRTRLELAANYRGRVAQLNYAFSLLSSQEIAALEERETAADALYWKMGDMIYASGVAAYENLVQAASSYDEFVSAYEQRQKIDVSGATVESQEELLARLEAAEEILAGKMGGNGWTLHNDIVATLENGSLRIYSEGKVRGSEVQEEYDSIGFVSYDKTFDVYDFSITYRIENYAMVSGADGYAYFGLYEKAAPHDINYPNKNKGICVQFVKNGNRLGVTLYVLRAVSLEFTMCAKGTYYIDYPADGTVTVDFKLAGDNVITSVNGVIPAEYSAIKQRECLGIFGEEGRGYLVVGSHMTPSDDVLNDDTLSRIGFGVSVDRVNGNTMDAADLTVIKTDVDDPNSSGNPSGGDDGCSGCGSSVGGSALLGLLILPTAIVMRKKWI